jgi:hypothetical protein
MRRALLLLLLTAASAAANTPAIRLQVYPKIGTSPQDVHFKVFVERNPANRKMILAIDGPSYYRSAEFQLDGEGAPRVFDLWRQQLPCGEYTVVAVVLRNDNSRSQVTDAFRLLGFGCATPADEP